MGEVWGRVAGARTVSEGEEEEEEEGEVGDGERHRHLPSGKLLINKLGLNCAVCACMCVSVCQYMCICMPVCV